MNGWTFWIERDGRFRPVDVFIADFDKAEAAALAAIGGGKVDSYTRQTAERMAKVRKPGEAREYLDASFNPQRGAVKRGSRADTRAARS